jgi:hypothetical protein
VSGDRVKPKQPKYRYAIGKGSQYNLPTVVMREKEHMSGSDRVKNDASQVERNKMPINPSLTTHAEMPSNANSIFIVQKIMMMPKR